MILSKKYSLQKQVLTILCLAIALPLAVSGLILLPIQNAISRRFERACDRYAIERTNDPEAFISTMDKLAEQNLADRTPNRVVEWLFYSHPSISRRIGMAKNKPEYRNSKFETNLKSK